MLVHVPLLKNKNPYKEKKIFLNLKDIKSYPVVKFQGKKIKEIINELFEDIYIVCDMKADVGIFKYGNNKFKLNINYQICEKNINYRNGENKIRIFEHSIIVDGDNIKFMVKDKEYNYKEILDLLFLSEFKYFETKITDIDKNVCTFDDYKTERESYGMIIEAYIY